MSGPELAETDVDVVIVGAGPAGLILSFILSGWTPYYDDKSFGPHPNGGLHETLLPYRGDCETAAESGSWPCLLDAVHDPAVVNFVDRQIESFYSSKVLPANLLIDALQASDESHFASAGERQSRVRWVHEPARAVAHAVLCAGAAAGGQWQSSAIDVPSDLSLSYAEMLSLPLYSFSENYAETRGKPPQDFFRPPRHDVAEYYAAWPRKVGIDSAIRYNAVVRSVVPINKTGERTYNVVYDGGQLRARRVVLASGVFEDPAARARLQCPVETVASSTKSCTCDFVIQDSPSCLPPKHKLPTLVVGTGVSAADAIGNTPGSVIHIFKWTDARGAPCTFRNFPRELYPEYVQVFKRMKQRKIADGSYEGLANARIDQVSRDGRVRIILDNGSTIERVVGAVKIRTGRRGSLAYLDPGLLPVTHACDVTKESMRDFVERARSLRVADGLYIVGSLCGDSLVRFLPGGCMWVARELSR